MQDTGAGGSPPAFFLVSRVQGVCSRACRGQAGLRQSASV